MPGAVWFYSLGTDKNLVISVYDDNSGIQTFESDEEGGEIELNMSFGAINFFSDISEGLTDWAGS